MHLGCSCLSGVLVWSLVCLFGAVAVHSRVAAAVRSCICGVLVFVCMCGIGYCEHGMMNGWCPLLGWKKKLLFACVLQVLQLVLHIRWPCIM